MKRLFGLHRARYFGLARTHARLAMAVIRQNLLKARKQDHPQPANTGNRIKPDHQHRVACQKASGPNRMAKSKLQPVIKPSCRGLLLELLSSRRIYLMNKWKRFIIGIGKVAVQVPRVRDRGASADGSKVRFNASLVPPYLRKAKSVEERLPWLYLKGISTGTSARYWRRWQVRMLRDCRLQQSHVSRQPGGTNTKPGANGDLTGKRYVDIWADGVYFNPRLDDHQCMLVIIGADAYGDKDVPGIMDGFRENADIWRDLLQRLRKQGLTIAPDLACGDGAPGFWTALRDVYPTVREQRCRVHKIANITGAMPKPMREKAKTGLQDIWMAETRKEAVTAFDLFVETYGVKYQRAVKKPTKDRDALPTFYDFPAEHWKHIRTTNPIESVFANVRNRTRKTKGCLNRKTALAMVFRLMMSAKKKWRKISGPNRLPEVIQGVEFKDGIKQTQIAA